MRHLNELIDATPLIAGFAKRIAPDCVQNLTVSRTTGVLILASSELRLATATTSISAREWAEKKTTLNRRGTVRSGQNSAALVPLRDRACSAARVKAVTRALLQQLTRFGSKDSFPARRAIRRRFWLPGRRKLFISFLDKNGQRRFFNCFLRLISASAPGSVSTRAGVGR